MGTEKGPQISQCTRSNTQWDTCWLVGKDSLFCLEKWQMSQHTVLLARKTDTRLLSKDNLA